MLCCVYWQSLNFTGHIMASLNENENEPEDHVHVAPTAQQEMEHSKASQVLESMWHLILETQSYKVDNEQLKKA